MSERLQGLLLILAGIGSMFLIYVVQHNTSFDFRQPVPPGLPPSLPIISPLACLAPMIGLGAFGLCLIGLKKLFAPDDWQPPKHLD
jgi:hypothetical protein